MCNSVCFAAVDLRYKPALISKFWQELPENMYKNVLRRDDLVAWFNNFIKLQDSFF